MEQKKSFRMTKDYDTQNDSLFMYITDEYDYKESVELGENVILDFDENDVPVAIEFLDATKFLNVSKFSLEHLVNLDMDIRIDADFISIDAVFKVLFHQKEVFAPVKLEVPNDLNFPHMQSEFALTA